MEVLFNPRKQRFIQLYVEAMFKDGVPQQPNGTEIARQAGYSLKSAANESTNLLKDCDVQAAIEKRLQDATAKANIDLQGIIKRWTDIATADPRKIAKLRKLNCRYCHGIDHKYQWDADEYAAAAMQALQDDPDGMPPLMEGGDGWRRIKPPHPYCPKCNGEGVEDYYVEDMDKLDGPEKYLIAGIKMGRYGLEIQYHNQMDALVNLAKCMGAFIERKEVSGPNGKAIPVAAVNVSVPTDPQQAAKLYQLLMEGKTE